MQVACFVLEYDEEVPQVYSMDGGIILTALDSLQKKRKGRHVTWKMIPLSATLFPIEPTRSCRPSIGLVKMLKHTYKEIMEND